MNAFVEKNHNKNGLEDRVRIHTEGTGLKTNEGQRTIQNEGSRKVGRN